MAFSGPPWTVRSAWRSPSRLSRLMVTRPVTGSLKMPVTTVRPFQTTALGSPTLTDTTCSSDDGCIFLLLVNTPVFASPRVPRCGSTLSGRSAYTTLLANETGSEIECGDLPKHGDRKGSPLLYNGLASLLRGCKMILALPSSGCFALFLSFANRVFMGLILRISGRKRTFLLHLQKL